MFFVLGQGNTSNFSKFWMPLDEYTSETMAGLERGDLLVGAGGVNEAIAVFEKGKTERVFSGKPLFTK